jgi:hypothetical protein
MGKTQLAITHPLATARAAFSAPCHHLLPARMPWALPRCGPSRLLDFLALPRSLDSSRLEPRRWPAMFSAKPTRRCAEIREVVVFSSLEDVPTSVHGPASNTALTAFSQPLPEKFPGGPSHDCDPKGQSKMGFAVLSDARGVGVARA